MLCCITVIPLRTYWAPTATLLVKKPSNSTKAEERANRRDVDLLEKGEPDHHQALTGLSARKRLPLALSLRFSDWWGRCMVFGTGRRDWAARVGVVDRLNNVSFGHDR